MTIQTEISGSDSKQYLSLREAAQLYGYTRDHLGLMIRRGRLEGVRLGNYYATTAVYMDEYIKNYSDTDDRKAKTKFSNKFRSNILDRKQSSSVPLVAVKRVVKSPEFVAVRQKSKTPDFGELQKHIDEVLTHAMPIDRRVSHQIATTLVGKLPEPKFIAAASSLVLTAPAVESLPAPSELEIIILPIRKMHAFERQIIISQAKQQKKTM